MLMRATQVAQNKMIRMVENVSLKDHIKSADMLTKNGLLSVNQLAAQIKITEAWKSLNIENYSVKMENNQLNRQTNDRSVRPNTVKLWKEDTRVKSAESSFIRDAARLWNQIPSQISDAKTLGMAKTQILKYCKSLPF